MGKDDNAGEIEGNRKRSPKMSWSDSVKEAANTRPQELSRLLMRTLLQRVAGSPGAGGDSMEGKTRLPTITVS